MLGKRLNVAHQPSRTDGPRTGARMTPTRTTMTPADGTPHHVGGPASATRPSDAVRAVLLAAGLIGGYLVFHELATLLVLVVITIVLALPLEVTATRLERYRVPRPIGALLALVAIVGAAVAVLAVSIPPFVSELQRFADQLPDLVDQLGSKLGETTGGAHPGHAGENLQRSLQRVLDRPQGLLGPLAQVGMGVAGAVAAMLLVLVGALYVAINPKPLVDGLLRLFPPDHRPWAQDALTEIRSSWVGWLYGVGADMVVTGTLLYIGLMLVGLDYALVFAVLSALFVVVPYFGAVAGGIPPVLFALAERGPTAAAITLGVYLLVQQIEGNLVIPVVMSRAVNLHPAVVLVGVVIVGNVLGFVGLIVAVPIISATMIIVRELWVRRVEGEAPQTAAPPAASG